MFQRASTPREYAEYVWYTTPSSSANALIPGPSYGRFAGSTCQPSSGRKLYEPPFATDSSVNDTLKSKLKSLRPDDAHGKFHPMRSRYAPSFASGARETAVNATSWFWRWRCVSSKPSAIDEQLGHPS